MAYRFLRFVDEGAVARLTLARPPLNVLTTEMMEELGHALASAAAQSHLKESLDQVDGLGLRPEARQKLIRDNASELFRP
jgi:hypothetical protein